MNAINEPNDNFPFDKLALTSPIAMSGGNHFMKFLLNDKPVYIQPPNCKLKQGIVKTGKRSYCDLMFTNENEKFIRWMENLETFSRKYIYNHRAKWFETELDEHDIENSFTSPLKIFKSGKYYIARINVQTILGKTTLKIYDENESVIECENLKENEDVATILEIQGIKCSARMFQIEMEMKQLLVLKPVDMFERCILKTPSKESLEKSIQEPQLEPITPTEPLSIEHLSTETIREPVEETIREPVEEPIREPVEEPIEQKEPPIEEQKEPSIEEQKEPSIEEQKEPSDLEEFELIVESDETVFLKKRDDVYYKMYREALRKAKEAKELALSSYLDAKHIKNTYMLTDLDDDDESDLEDDFDFDPA
jgi:hypothetical protein